MDTNEETLPKPEQEQVEPEQVEPEPKLEQAKEAKNPKRVMQGKRLAEYNRKKKEQIANSEVGVSPLSTAVGFSTTWSFTPFVFIGVLVVSGCAILYFKQRGENIELTPHVPESPIDDDDFQMA